MIAFDVTEINRLRRRLRGQPTSALLRLLQREIEDLPVAALVADNSARYIAANARAVELTGYSHDELLHMTVRDITPAHRDDARAELWNRFIQTGSQSGEYVLQRKDGMPVAVRYHAFASVAPGIHVSLLAPLEVPSSI